MVKKEIMLDMYYKMNLTRSFNDELIELKKQSKIYGPIHNTKGQEAIGIGVGAALSVKKGIYPRNIQYKDLRNILIKEGAIV